MLDALVADRPVRVQHRTGQLWVLNSAALARTGIESLSEEGIERDGSGRATGRLFRRDELRAPAHRRAAPDVARRGRELASFGITAVTDMTPATDPDHLAALADAAARARLPDRCRRHRAPPRWPTSTSACRAAP